MSRGSYQEDHAAILTFLVKAPRTVPEICNLLWGTNNRSKKQVVARWLRVLEAEGLVTQQAEKIKNPKGRPTPVWEWSA